MKIFAISDLHLSTKAEKPMDIFGDGWQNHFEKISDDWRKKVGADDIVLLGGDMSWGLTVQEAKPDYDLVSALPGEKYVVKGNHDYYWNSLSKMRKEFPSFRFIQNNAYRIESSAPHEARQFAEQESKKNKHLSLTEPIKQDKAVIIAGTRGWNIPSKDSTEEDIKVFNRELVRLDLSLSSAQALRKDGDVLIAMLHYPPFEATYQSTQVTDILEKYGVDYVLYGHLHGKNVRVTPRVEKNGIEYILTSCDLVNNKLIEVCEITE